MSPEVALSKIFPISKTNFQHLEEDVSGRMVQVPREECLVGRCGSPQRWSVDTERHTSAWNKNISENQLTK